MGLNGRGTGASILPAALRNAPLLATCEELQDRRARLWWGSRLFSFALHAMAVASIIQSGVIVVNYSMRFGSGFQFGQAVLLTSPMFEISQRDSRRGSERSIPLSALVPEQKLYAPDLRLLRAVTQTPAPSARSTGSPTAQDSPGSPIGIPGAGLPGSAGLALPEGELSHSLGRGAAAPFDLIPPSNTRAPRPEQKQQVRIGIGDPGIPGGGAAEGLRLPASPGRIGISAEITLESGNAAALESWLRTLVSRLRRASFEVMPDRRDLGAPGLVRLALQLDPSGRISRRRISAGSGNAALDRLALALVDSIPSFEPLPESALPQVVTITVFVRYFPAR
jgi:TonB family protein